jgi:hypothetical protein
MENTKITSVTEKTIEVKIDKLLPDGLNIDKSSLDKSTLLEDLQAALLKPLS